MGGVSGYFQFAYLLYFYLEFLIIIHFFDIDIYENNLFKYGQHPNNIKINCKKLMKVEKQNSKEQKMRFMSSNIKKRKTM